MSQTQTIDLACDACGKRYTLKPELAGKRVKCKCGHAMSLPSPATRAPKVTTVDDDQGVYDFADEPAKPVMNSIAKPPVPIARSAASVAAGRGGALSYETTRKDRFAADNLIDNRRDVYFPTGLFIVGMLGLLAWAVFAAHASSEGIILFSLLILVKTVIKVGVLIGLALLVAPAAGLSFGSFWHAVLKFAAIIVFADMVLMWTESWIDSLGGSGGGNRRGRSMVGLLKTLLLAAFIAIQCRFLFDMDSEETGMIAVPMAIVNRILEFVLWIVIIGVLEGMMTATVAPAPPPVTSPAVAAPSSAQGPDVAEPAPPVNPLAERDAKIRVAIQRGAKEGHEWVAQFHVDKLHDDVYNTINSAAPKRLYFQLAGVNLVSVFVELPDDPETREKVLAAANAMKLKYSANKTPQTDVGQRYLAFSIPDNRKRK